MYLHGGVVRSHRPELLWPHVRTCLSTPSYICVSIVKITPCPPEEPTPLRFAIRLRIPKPMLPFPLLG